MAEDALQRRIASFVAEAKAPYSVNGTADISLGTCIGAVRDQNQDRALITFACYPTAPEKSLPSASFARMGGLARGDEAAVIAVSVFASRVTQWPSQPTGQPGDAAAINSSRFVGMGDGIAPRIIDADQNASTPS